MDFETFSELSINDVGTARYAEHPSTEVLCLGWALNDEEPEVWTPDQDPPDRLFDLLMGRCTVHAWNVEMEISTWEKVCVERMGWPPVNRRKWRDTQALALSFAFPGKLEKCGSVLDLDVQKDKRGKQLIQRLCKPRKPTKNNPLTRLTPESNPQDFLDFYEYCRTDVLSERAIHHAMPEHSLSPEELEIWRLTMDMNLRGWTVDMESVDLMIGMLTEHRERCLHEVRALTGFAINSTNQTEKAIAWLDTQGVKMPNFQAATVERFLRKKRLPRRARRLLEIRQQESKTSVKKLEAMKARVCEDGTVKNNLQYHGAGTGRDAGRGQQIQNFPRDVVAETEGGVELAFETLRLRNLRTVELLYGSVPHWASSMLRPMLIAADGQELHCADLSSIENRMTVWLADCQYGIDLFNKGLDEYRMFASRRLGKGYDDVSKKERNDAKGPVLGCCFGQGWKGYKKSEKEKYGRIHTTKESKEAVNFWREVYHEVVDYWYELEKAAKRAIKTGRKVRCKRISFYTDSDFLFMVLPSGRRLSYYKPKVKMMETPWGEPRATIVHMGVDGKTKQWIEKTLIPGRIFENAVQAVARDVMMHGVRKTTRAGYDLVGRVHDELVSQAPIGRGSTDEYVRLMSDTEDLPWLDGIPIAAEGWSGKRYRKE